MQGCPHHNGIAAHIKQNQVPTSNGIACPHRPEYAANYSIGWGIGHGIRVRP
jgi:hypothetical protein